jgi:hypothetical protein
VAFTINATDTAGNSMITVTGVTDTSSVSIDTEKVLINGLKVVPTHTAVSLDFTTTENAKSTLLYGLTNAYGFISEIATILTSNHVASVGGLMACTTYQFALRVNRHCWKMKFHYIKMISFLNKTVMLLVVTVEVLVSDRR